ncbi:MAG: hypothetical protein DI533_20020 [Cereibacter sphaeroides]|uniref:Uncharacterized protein n=1 Tax=Cereibacter sphaeroides TaxID=1063 RepID=A0A2W5UB01_CERSP|nr:MAG: hypothetical protein DI533_20020 [Cereibacter sphaeroides]
MQQGFHLNIARVTEARAWDYTPAAPKYVVTHFVSVFLGDNRDVERAKALAAEVKARFPEGDKPGEFQFRLTGWFWQGQEVAL